MSQRSIPSETQDDWNCFAWWFLWCKTKVTKVTNLFSSMFKTQNTIIKEFSRFQLSNSFIGEHAIFTYMGAFYLSFYVLQSKYVIEISLNGEKFSATSRSSHPLNISFIFFAICKSQPSKLLCTKYDCVALIITLRHI